MKNRHQPPLYYYYLLETLTNNAWFEQLKRNKDIDCVVSTPLYSCEFSFRRNEESARFFLEGYPDYVPSIQDRVEDFFFRNAYKSFDIVQAVGGKKWTEIVHLVFRRQLLPDRKSGVFRVILNTNRRKHDFWLGKWQIIEEHCSSGTRTRLELIVLIEETSSETLDSLDIREMVLHLARSWKITKYSYRTEFCSIDVPVSAHSLRYGGLPSNGYLLMKNQRPQNRNPGE